MSLLWDLGFRQSLCSHFQGCCIRPPNPSWASVSPPQSREEACLPEEVGRDHSGQPCTDATMRCHRGCKSMPYSKGIYSYLHPAQHISPEGLGGGPCACPLPEHGERAAGPRRFCRAPVPAHGHLSSPQRCSGRRDCCECSFGHPHSRGIAILCCSGL